MSDDLKPTAEWALGRPARSMRYLAEPMARAIWAEQERDEVEARAEAAEQQAARLRAAYQRLEQAAIAAIGRIGNNSEVYFGLVDALHGIEESRAASTASQPTPADEAQDYAPRPYLCVRCGGQYRIERRVRLRCAVDHPEGACCHMGEIEVTPPHGGQAEGEE